MRLFFPIVVREIDESVIKGHIGQMKESRMLINIDSSLDARGVCCPLPLIRIAKSVMNLKPGQTLEIIGNEVAAANYNVTF